MTTEYPRRNYSTSPEPQSHRWRNTALITLAIFACVFTLLFFRMWDGQDPMLGAKTAATTSSSQQSGSSEAETGSTWDDEQDEGDQWWSDDSDSPAQQTQAAPQPSTSAS